MKKIVSFMAAAVMAVSMMGTAIAGEMKFTDVNTSDWFYKDVKSAVEMGLVNGKTDTTYAPDDNLTYAEAIKLAACMNQLYVDGEITLSGGNPWYQPYVDYCEDEEIIDKEYNYADVATRAGYMEIFAKALPDEGLKAINNVPDDSILDVPSSKAYAPGVYKLYRAGILTGVDDDHNCNPLANIKRSEVAAILTRMMNEEARVKFDMGAGEQETEQETETTEPLAIKTQPELTTAVKVNETATLTVEVEGGKEPYTYQWQVGRTVGKQKTFGNLSDRETVSGALTAELSLTATEANQSEFRCVITDANGESVTSRVVIVKFEAAAETTTENTESSSGGQKDKFQKVDAEEPKKEDFTMTIDDSFVVTGRGIIITGYVAGGKLEKGDTIYINDADGEFIVETKVVNIEMFRKLIDKCEKGDNAGLQLDLDVETWREKLQRGYVASATKGTVSTRHSTGTRPSTGMTRPTIGSNTTEEEEESSTTSGGRVNIPTGKNEYME